MRTMYNFFYCLRDGVHALFRSLRGQCAGMIYVIFVAVTWYLLQMHLTDNSTVVILSGFLKMLLAATDLMVLLALLLALGGINVRLFLDNGFLKINFQNSKNELPVLKRKIAKGYYWELHFLSPGIPLEMWERKQPELESALNITISEMRYGADQQTIVIRCIVGRMDYYSTLVWTDNNFTDYFSTSLILGISMGCPVVLDLAVAPHILIGGATGSGKTFLLKLLLMQALRKDYRVVILDYKGGVDFSAPMWQRYACVIVTKAEMVKELDRIETELERRKEIFREGGYKDIDEYNAANTVKMQRIVVACDEISDLLDTAGLSKEEKELTKTLHARLNTLIRLGRAFGIHEFIATQRPSADVIGGTLKNNAVYKVAGKSDAVLSQMILDDTVASEVVPKDSTGVFVNHDRVVFKGYAFDEKNFRTLWDKQNYDD